MVCQVCGKNPATVHFTEIHDNKMSEMHVCERCADEKGLHAGAPGQKFDIADLLAGMVDTMTTSDEERVGRIQCPRCGLLYSAFRETGRLGCAECYAAFQYQLKPLLRRIHGECVAAAARNVEPDFIDVPGIQMDRVPFIRICKSDTHAYAIRSDLIGSGRGVDTPGIIDAMHWQEMRTAIRKPSFRSLARRLDRSGVRSSDARSVTSRTTRGASCESGAGLRCRCWPDWVRTRTRGGGSCTRWTRW